MAVTVSESLLPRLLSTGRNPTAEHHYTVQGTGDEVEARTALALSAPSAIDPYGTGLVLIPRETVMVEAVSDDVWSGVVRYGYTAPETDEPSESFDTTGGQQHITQSLQTVAVYTPAGETAPDFGGAIGVTSDRDVEGVDKITPVYQFELTYFFAAADVTLAYRSNIFRLTGKVNNAAFKGFAAGECLFLGASGQRQGNGKWEIRFRFAASPNLDPPGITINGIDVTSKKGWEYLWIQYIDVEDAAAKTLGKRPVSVYVERIYNDGDFGLLNIGT